MKQEELIGDINMALKDYDTVSFTGRVHAKKAIIGIADEHAKQQAISFAEWVWDNPRIERLGDKWAYDETFITLTELYDLWIKEL